MSNENVQGEMVLYNTSGGDVRLDVLVNGETVWLSQAQMAELFGRDISTISRHIRNVFDEKELDEKSNLQKMQISTSDRPIVLYSLDVIISVGYRVKSLEGVRFRQWATGVLREYMIKGFSVDVERMKQGGQLFGKDYFRDLLETVRSIRASERRIWQQITDIFAEISYDYDKKSEVTKRFYATVQNKFHYAITGKTAAEIIYDTVDKTKEYMGLTSWKNSPDGRILQSDVTVAKNYLSPEEIRKLERSVSAFFDYVERLLEEETMLSMADFEQSIDAFLSFNRYQVLEGKGKISKEKADEKAVGEYRDYNKTQKIISDFDRVVKSLENEGKQ